MIDLTLILAAGVASGTILLFAAVGEIFAERAGVLNLGVQGMMLIGAVAGFSVTASVGDPWVGVAVAMLAGGLLGLVHAVVTITFRADQVISGLALTFLGSGLARVLGDGLSNAGPIVTLPRLTIPVLSEIPFLGPVLFRDQSILTYVGFVLVPLAWYWIDRTRPGLHLRAVGERPAAADAQGIDVVALRYVYVLVGGLLAGLAGAAITLAISARLVRRPDRGCQRLDRDRPGDLRAVEPDPGGARGVPVRGDLPVHPRRAGCPVDLRCHQPVPGGTIGHILPRDAAVPVRDRGGHHRVARGAAATDRGTGRPGDPVRPG